MPSLKFVLLKRYCPTMTPFTVAMAGQSLIHHDIRASSDSSFHDIVQMLKTADVAFTNLETTITGRHPGWPMKGSFFGCSEPLVLDVLEDMGINTLSLANNHAFDLGPGGVLSTIEEVGARGFLHAGTGADRAIAMTPRSKRLGAKTVTLAAMDAGPGPATMYADDAASDRPARPGVNRLEVRRLFGVDPEKFDMLTAIQSTFKSGELERANYYQPDDAPIVSDPRDIDFYGTVFRRSAQNRRHILIDQTSASNQLATISDAAHRGEFVIAYLHHHHWEPDWREVPDWVRVFARRCVDAGARIFACHGAPVLQPVEIYKSAPLFFGLGNFIFHVPEHEAEWNSPDVWKSVIARCSFNEDGALCAMSLDPIILGGEKSLETGLPHTRRVPVLARSEMGRSIIADLARRSACYGTKIEADCSSGRLVL